MMQHGEQSQPGIDTSMNLEPDLHIQADFPIAFAKTTAATIH